MAGETNEADEAMVVLSAGHGPVMTALVDLPEQDRTAKQPQRCVCVCTYICSMCVCMVCACVCLYVCVYVCTECMLHAYTQSV